MAELVSAEAVEQLARAVHRMTFPKHADCNPDSVDLRNARQYLEAMLNAGYVHRDEIERTVRQEAAKELEQIAQDEAEDMLSEADYGPDATVYRAVTVASIMERAEVIRNG